MRRYIHRKSFSDAMLSNVFITKRRLVQCERIKSKLFLHLFHRHGVPPVLQDLFAMRILFDIVLLSVYESFDGAEILKVLYIWRVICQYVGRAFSSL